MNAGSSASSIVILWDSQVVSVSDSWIGEFSASAMLEDLANNSKWPMTYVYGPNYSGMRLDFWKELGSWNGPCCVGGDRNVIRFSSEKLGGCHFKPDMRSFSDWIEHHDWINHHSLFPMWCLFYVVQSSISTLEVQRSTDFWCLANG